MSFREFLWFGGMVKGQSVLSSHVTVTLVELRTEWRFRNNLHSRKTNTPGTPNKVKDCSLSRLA